METKFKFKKLPDSNVSSLTRAGWHQGGHPITKNSFQHAIDRQLMWLNAKGWLSTICCWEAVIHTLDYSWTKMNAKMMMNDQLYWRQTEDWDFTEVVPTISPDSLQNSRLHTGARVNFEVLTYVSHPTLNISDITFRIVVSVKWQLDKSKTKIAILPEVFFAPEKELLYIFIYTIWQFQQLWHNVKFDTDW